MNSLDTLPGARFECHGCGGCCRNFSIGPVAESTIRDLEARGAASLMGENGSESFYETEMGDEGVEYFFRTKDQACVFLDGANLCRIHATYGAQAKPWFCRAFPFALVAGPEGLRLALRPECEGRPGESPSSPPLSSYAQEVLEDAQHYPFRAVFPEGIGLPGGQPLPAGAYPSLERALIEEAHRPRSHFDEVFPALADLLGAAAAALPQYPGRPVAPGSGSLGSLCRVVRTFLADRSGQPAQEYFAQGVNDLLDGKPAAARLTPEAAAFLRQELANHIFSGAVTVYGGLGSGLGAFLFATLVARGFASRAGEPVGLVALNQAWTRWYKGLGWRDPRGCFASAHGLLEALFLEAAQTGQP